jgi:sodium/hydrogen antiporter
VKWALAIVAMALLVVAATLRWLRGTPVTAPMAFVLMGLLVGPLVIDQLDLGSTSVVVRTLAEATLALVLFSDASRIDLRALRREYTVPLRLLGVGLPLTIGLGAMLGAVMLSRLTVLDAVALAVVLAPTDAALGAVVVNEPSLRCVSGRD